MAPDSVSPILFATLRYSYGGLEMLQKPYLALHCLVGLLVRVSLARRSLRAQFVVFVMKCGDEESHET